MPEHVHPPEPLGGAAKYVTRCQRRIARRVPLSGKQRIGGGQVIEARQHLLAGAHGKPCPSVVRLFTVDSQSWPSRHRNHTLRFDCSAIASGRRSPFFAGFGIFSPSEVTAKSLMPRSTPTTAPVAGSCTGSATSTANETYQRPHGSRETVTVVGPADAGSTSGHDHTNASGVSILARNSLPSRHRNPDRVYSADW